jgi:hypothetical protein
LLSLSSENQSAAQSLVSRSFDVVFEGDDPGEVFAFDLPFDPSSQASCGSTVFSRT